MKVTASKNFVEVACESAAEEKAIRAAAKAEGLSVSKWLLRAISLSV